MSNNSLPADVLMQQLQVSYLRYFTTITIFCDHDWARRAWTWM